MSNVTYDARTALVVVDLQNDFADPAGGLAVSDAEAIVPHVNAAVNAALEGGALVVATQDWHPERTPHFVTDGGIWPVHCVAETWGAELHPAFEMPMEAPRIRKGSNGEDGYSGFTTRDPVTGDESATELEHLLREAWIERVVLCGLATDYCVRATALDARRLGFDVTLLADAVAAVNVEAGDGDKAVKELLVVGVSIA